MSQQQEYSIRCPKCGQEQTAQLYDAINVQTEPELRDQLMQNKINAVQCVSCASSFRVDKPLLYHDPARGILVYWVPAPAGAEATGERQFADLLLALAERQPPGIVLPAVHLVFSRLEWVERIFLLEAGLDERMIEYVKHLIYLNNHSQVDPRKKTLLFNAQDSTPENLCFVVQDVASRKLERLLHYNRKAYAELCALFAGAAQAQALRKLFPSPYVSARAVLLQTPVAAALGTAPQD
ncbi:MAG: CpXC domain-containing protein [Kiritimatiellaeota bacterium]|nr:CpXC domain-containing protein [Kiritimatiellota bacterium]